jgi:hypothetical protein
MCKPLEKEFKYYLDNQDELVKKYNGKVIVIKNQKIIGVYDSEITAIQETSKNESLGTFLVQKCTLDKENYKQTYHSRVAFS